MKEWTAYVRTGMGGGFAGLLLAGCASTLPAPTLKISSADTTYVKVISVKQPVGIVMTQIAFGGVIPQVINDSTPSESQRFYELVKDDPRTQALEQLLRDRVIAEAKSAGITLQDGQDLDLTALKSNQQVIVLRGFSTYYFARTIAHRYTPYASTQIESSRDPAIPLGQTRFARISTAHIEDNKYAFTGTNGVFRDPSVSMDGLTAATDELAKQVAKDLSAAK